jgi:DNA adenine methylase
MVNTLLPLIPPHKIYCEVFGGGGSLLLNKPQSEIEVYNDIDGRLVNLFMVLRDHSAEFQRRLAGLPYSRKLFDEWRAALERGDAEDDPIEKAVQLYYCLRAGFSGKLKSLNWAVRRSHSSPLRFKNALAALPAIAKRLQLVNFECSDFRRCIRNWDSEQTFFFLDPPYMGCESYYPGNFSLKDHEDLREMLGKTEGRWLLTYGDHPWIREKYRGYNIQVKLTAKLAQGFTRFQHRDKRSYLSNLIITNYTPPVKVPRRYLLTPITLFGYEKC